MRLGAFPRGGEGVRLDEAEFQRRLSLERLGEQEKLGRLGAPEALRRKQRGAGLRHEARIDEGRQRSEFDRYDRALQAADYGFAAVGRVKNERTGAGWGADGPELSDAVRPLKGIPPGDGWIEFADSDLVRSPIRRLVGFPGMELSLIGLGVPVAAIGQSGRRANNGEHGRRREDSDQ